MAVAPYTTRGARLFIGPAVTAAPADAAAYAALTWTEIKNIRTSSPFGEARPIISRVVIGRDHPIKKVGPADPGNFIIMLHPDDGDAGQVALASAASTRSKYAVKIEHPPGSKIAPTALVSTRYFSAIVAASANQLGGSDDLATDQFTFEIVTQIVRVASVIPPGRFGDASISLGALSLIATAQAPVTGTLSVTLAPLTLMSGDMNNALLVETNTLSVGGNGLTL